jgi:hypothetical protein
MTTVQIAIKDKDYALLLKSLLVREQEYTVLIVDRPDLTIPGLIVLADSLLDASNSFDPERMIVVASRRTTRHLRELWRARLRNVVFPDDSPQTAFLAIMAARERLLASPHRPHPILLLSRPAIGLEGNALRGPFALTDSVIDEEVTDKSAGAFALDDSDNGTRFSIVFVGRSDLDVNNQLHVYVGTYQRFKFVYCSSARAAFERQCSLFHDFDPRDNLVHPLRQANTNWNCPRCKLFG